MSSTNVLTVYEHQALRVVKGELSETQLEALQSFYGEGVPYYSLIHKGVKFCEYVGVIQVGATTIEILPKTDKDSADSQDESTKWRNVLVGMLRAVGGFKVSPSSSSLRIRHNSILHLYVELFLTEVETLLHQGLTKHYRQTEANNTSLKGSLQFGKHIQQNLVHQERFYVRHTIYDKTHPLNQVLYKTLKLLNRINTNPALHSRIGALLLNFPEMPGISVSEAFFERIVYTRKNESYRKSIGIARLLLLNYHPDIRKGQNHVLALLFNMNLLWEQFVYASLRKYCPPGVTITAQHKRAFWKSEIGSDSSLKPDIVINLNQQGCIVLDTKWKNIGDGSPQPQDLQQMYTYLSYFNATRIALIYPGQADRIKGGKFYGIADNSLEKECNLISIRVDENISNWQKAIANQFFLKTLV